MAHSGKVNPNGTCDHKSESNVVQVNQSYDNFFSSGAPVVINNIAEVIYYKRR